jgi:hypothetical protein
MIPGGIATSARGPSWPPRRPCRHDPWKDRNMNGETADARAYLVVMIPGGIATCKPGWDRCRSRYRVVMIPGGIATGSLTPAPVSTSDESAAADIRRVTLLSQVHRLCPAEMLHDGFNTALQLVLFGVSQRNLVAVCPDERFPDGLARRPPVMEASSEQRRRFGQVRHP